MAIKVFNHVSQCENLNNLRTTIYWLQAETKKTLKLLTTYEKLNDHLGIKKCRKKLIEISGRLLHCDKELINLGLVEA